MMLAVLLRTAPSLPPSVPVRDPFPFFPNPLPPFPISALLQFNLGDRRRRRYRNRPPFLCTSVLLLEAATASTPADGE